MPSLPQHIQDDIRKLEEQFTVDTDKLKKTTDHFVSELEKGI